MNQSKKVFVRTTEQLRDALESGIDSQRIIIQVAEADAIKQLEVARAEGFEVGRKAAREALQNSQARGIHHPVAADVAAKERARIMGIQGLARPGLENIARLAIDAGDSVEQFALRMVREVNDRGVTLDDIRRDSPRAVGFSAAPDDSDSASRRRGFPDGKGVFAARQARPPAERK